MTPEICHHVRQNGRRCGSPALRGKFFCYFHNHAASLRKRDIAMADDELYRKIKREVDTVFRNNGIMNDVSAEYFGYVRIDKRYFDFPALEDRASVQIALSMVLKAVGQGWLTPKTASVILHNLRLAIQNLRGLELDPTTVTDFTTDEIGNPIAVDEDTPNPSGLKTLAATPTESTFSDDDPPLTPAVGIPCPQ